MRSSRGLRKNLPHPSKPASGSGFSTPPTPERKAAGMSLRSAKATAKNLGTIGPHASDLSESHRNLSKPAGVAQRGDISAAWSGPPGDESRASIQSSRWIQRCSTRSGRPARRGGAQRKHRTLPDTGQVQPTASSSLAPSRQAGRYTLCVGFARWDHGDDERRDTPDRGEHRRR